MESKDTLQFSLNRANPFLIRQGLLQNNVKKIRNSIDSDLIDQFKDKLSVDHKLNLPKYNLSRFSQAKKMSYQGLDSMDDSI